MSTEAGAELRTLRAMTIPSEGDISTKMAVEVKSMWEKRLDTLATQDAVLFRGETVPGRKVIWTIATERVQLLDSPIQDKAMAYISKNIDNAKDFYIATEPLVESCRVVETAISDYRNHQDMYRSEGYADTRLAYFVDVKDPIQKYFLNQIEYVPPGGCGRYEIPIGIIFGMKATEMSQLLDVARKADGSIDETMLKDLFTYGSKMLPEESLQPVRENVSNDVVRKMENFMGGEIKRKNVGTSTDWLRDSLHKAEKNVGIAPGNIDLLTDKLRSIGDIIGEGKNFSFLLDSDLINFPEGKSEVVGSIARINAALSIKKRGEAYKIDPHDVDLVLNCSRAIGEVHKSMTNLADMISEEQRKYSREITLNTDVRIDHIVKGIISNVDTFDFIWHKDAQLRHYWSYIVSAVQGMVNTNAAISSYVQGLV